MQIWHTPCVNSISAIVKLAYTAYKIKLCSLNAKTDLAIASKQTYFHKPETTWMKIASSTCYYIPGIRLYVLTMIISFIYSKHILNFVIHIPAPILNY
jgi:hypothetical protein